jgi:hypothetical protein
LPAAAAFVLHFARIGNGAINNHGTNLQLRETLFTSEWFSIERGVMNGELANFNEITHDEGRPNFA